MNTFRFSAAALLCAVLFVVCDGKSIDVVIQEAINETEAAGLMQPLEPNVMKVELDMLFVLPNGTEIHGKDTYKAIRGEQYRWTYKTLPYTFQPYAFSAAEQQLIRGAMDIWSQWTCVKFAPRSNQQYYINIVNGGGCSSYVGMTRLGAQAVTLAPACRITRIILHELGHAIGFQHEQCRTDRDSYIRVYLRNVHPSKQYNFDKYSAQEIEDRGVKYDYKSIMHYGETAFSMNGQRTIETIDPYYQRLIGNYRMLSFNDVMLANLIYSCNAACNPKKDCPGGYQGKDCQCWCPSGNDNIPAKVCDGSDEVCADKHQHCAYWTGLGYCTHPSYQEYMRINCEKSCGYC